MVHVTEEVQSTARTLLSGVSEQEAREVCLAGLRTWWKQRQPDIGLRTTFAMHGAIGLYAIPILAARKNLSVDALKAKEAFCYCQHLEWMKTVVEFAGWLVRAGYAVPLFHNDLDTNGYPINFYLTEAGERLLGSDEDNPLLPGFLNRISARCRGVPRGTLAMLADARSCLDNGLLRPATIMLGVAYEIVLEEVVDSMIATGHLPAPTADLRAAKRIKAVRNAVPKVLANRDEIEAAERACDFANTLRGRRNDSAHTKPVFDFSDRTEVEELYVSAGRYLPAIWALKRHQPNA